MMPFMIKGSLGGPLGPPDKGLARWSVWSDRYCKETLDLETLDVSGRLSPFSRDYKVGAWREGDNLPFPVTLLTS